MDTQEFSIVGLKQSALGFWRESDATGLDGNVELILGRVLHWD